MQKTFQFTLTGKAWFLVFLFLYVLMALIVACGVTLGLNAVSGTTGTTQPVFTLIAAIGMFVFILGIMGWIIPVYRKFISHVAFDSKPFHFKGSIPAFIGLNLLGIFLSIITLTIYLPWYMRKIMNYIITNIEYDGKPLEFSGKGSNLFVTMLWAFYIPMIILIAFAAANRDVSTSMKFNFANQFLSQILFIPFGYKIYQWMFNHVSWQGKNTHWNTKFWRSIGFMLGQTLLTFITLFIYWPASVIRIYRYFAARTEIQENGVVKGRFEFQGKVGKGFLLLWGQVLLSIITLGIYIPWAAAKIYKWIIEETKYIPA